MKTSPSSSLRAASGRRSNLTIFALFLVAAFVVPVFASAATSAGVTPGSFWYFFDTASEKVALFFAFNPENKAKKALEYADERLAEIDAIAEEKNPEAVKTAIADYEGNVALATEKSKEVKDKERAESLLAFIQDNASKNQEVLSAVLIKVPEEAKAAITKAIEASKRGQEEAARQIADLKGEVEQLKQEVAELRAKDEKKQRSIEELSEKKVESQTTPAKSSNSQIPEVAPTLKPATPSVQSSTKTTSIVTFPSGAVVEMGADGNVIRTIKEAPQLIYIDVCNNIEGIQTAVPSDMRWDNNQGCIPLQLNVQPAPVVPPTSTLVPRIQKLEITTTGRTVDTTTAKIEWQTDRPSESKLYLSGGGLTSKLYASEAGYATSHFVNLTQLIPTTEYSLQITAIGENGFANLTWWFQTKTPPPTIKFERILQNVALGTREFRIAWKSTYTDSCFASGAWSGSKPTNGEEILSLNQIGIGEYVHTLICEGKNTETITENTILRVVDNRPRIYFYFNNNDTPLNTFLGRVGETVKLRWETTNSPYDGYFGSACHASNSWTGGKHTYGSQDILLETVGEFFYTLTCYGNGPLNGVDTATITATQ